MAKLLDVNAVAERVGMSASWVRKQLMHRTFPEPQLKTGGKNLWREEVIDGWINQVAPLPQPQDAA